MNCVESSSSVPEGTIHAFCFHTVRPIDFERGLPDVSAALSARTLAGQSFRGVADRVPGRIWIAVPSVIGKAVLPSSGYGTDFPPFHLATSVALALSGRPAHFGVVRRPCSRRQASGICVRSGNRATSEVTGFRAVGKRRRAGTTGECSRRPTAGNCVFGTKDADSNECH